MVLIPTLPHLPPPKLQAKLAHLPFWAILEKSSPAPRPSRRAKKASDFGQCSSMLIAKLLPCVSSSEARSFCVLQHLWDSNCRLGHVRQARWARSKSAVDERPNAVCYRTHNTSFPTFSQQPFANSPSGCCDRMHLRPPSQLDRLGLVPFLFLH
jgi:hypothetical protein